MQTHSRLADAVPAARMSREKCYIDPDVGRPHERSDVILAPFVGRGALHGRLDQEEIPMRNRERTSVSLATCVATILSLVAIPIVTQGQTTGTASTPRPLTPLEQVWYSGSGDGYHYRLDFTSPDRCACVRRSVGQSTFTGGSANFTDPATGKLLLYSDGKTVFNGQTHKALYNGTGLSGADNGNPVQITPFPGPNRQLFYIFTNNGSQVQYSVADLTPVQPNMLDGQVTPKNQPLANNTGAAQGMVPHATNPQSIWLLVYNTANTLAVYEVKQGSAISSAPTASSPTGLSVNASLNQPFIVHSPDYNTLALSDGYYYNGIAIAKIDRATGKLSDAKLRVTKTPTDLGYSCAFSPDGTKLYYARGSFGTSGTPYQFDLTTETETQLNTTSGFGAPKLAPDGRIYWTGSNKDALSVVPNPNAPGPGVIFLLNDLYLNGAKAAYALPRQTVAFAAYASAEWSGTVNAQQAWVDTGMDLNAGDTLTISANGAWSNAAGGTAAGPDGFPIPASDGPLSTANLAALIGKVGNAIFSVGSAYNKTSPGTGRLYLQMNDGNLSDNSGTLSVSVKVQRQ